MLRKQGKETKNQNERPSRKALSLSEHTRILKLGLHYNLGFKVLGRQMGDKVSSTVILIPTLNPVRFGFVYRQKHRVTKFSLMTRRLKSTLLNSHVRLIRTTARPMGGRTVTLGTIGTNVMQFRQRVKQMSR